MKPVDHFLKLNPGLRRIFGTRIHYGKPDLENNPTACAFIIEEGDSLVIKTFHSAHGAKEPLNARSLIVDTLSEHYHCQGRFNRTSLMDDGLTWQNTLHFKRRAGDAS